MLFTNWVVFSQTLWVYFAWGLLFLFQPSVLQTFTTTYNFNIFERSLIPAGTICKNVSRNGYESNPGLLLYQIQEDVKGRETGSRGQTVPQCTRKPSLPAGLFWYG
jgi:hypothetical protein